MLRVRVYYSEGNITLLVAPRLLKSVLLGIDAMIIFGVPDTRKWVIKVRDKYVGRLIGGYWQMTESQVTENRGSKTMEKSVGVKLRQR